MFWSKQVIVELFDTNGRLKITIDQPKGISEEHSVYLDMFRGDTSSEPMFGMSFDHAEIPGLIISLKESARLIEEAQKAYELLEDGKKD